MSVYQYLFWDIDGTILDFTAAERAAICSLFGKYGFGECREEQLQSYALINDQYWKKLERKEMTKPQILVKRFEEFFAQEGFDVSLAEAFNRDYQNTLGDTIVFRDDAKNILLEEKKSFVLAAVTNGTETAQKKKLSRSGLDRIFDEIFISEKMGCVKPEKRFFDLVFEKMGITDPAKVMIIGDSLSSDILGGVNAGICTCWYNPERKTNTSSVKPDYEIADLHELKNILEAE